LVLKNILQN